MIPSLSDDVLNVSAFQQYKPSCPVYFTIDILRRKWAVKIIFRLYHHHAPVRFNEIERELAPITQKELTKRLRALESAGIITRTVYAEVPPRVEYTLTDAGLELMPALFALRAWGEQYRRLSETEIGYNDA